MYSKNYQKTASTRSSYTPIAPIRTIKEFQTPQPFQLIEQPISDSLIDKTFQQFRNQLWQQTIRNISQQQKQTINKKINYLQSTISNAMKTWKQNKQTSTPSIDYSEVLMLKQNQIISLQRKINSYEQLSTNKDSKCNIKSIEIKMKDTITKLSSELKSKQNILKTKNQFIISEFNYYNDLKQNFKKVKQIFDKTQNKGDLQRLFDGMKLPSDRDFNIDQLIKDNPVFRSKAIGQNRIKSLIHILYTQISQSSIQTEGELENMLTQFIIQNLDSKLKHKLDQNSKLMNQNNLLMIRFNAAAGIWTSQLKDIKRQYPSARIEIDNNITKLLIDSKVNVSLVGNVVQLQSNPIIEVPMAESKTSQLLLTVCKELRRLSLKYPKINVQLSDTVAELLNEGVIDFMQVGNDPNKIIEIVRYLPQQTKTEDHLYTFNGDQNRRLQFHLRVLIKTLLQQLDRLKNKTGQVLQIDQSIIKMMQQQILEVVNVDDILKVFKVNTKIVQVEKIIQKVVEKIVQVPQIIPIQKVVQRIIEVPKIQQIQKTVNVPVQIIKIVDNFVEKIVEIQRVIEIVKEVPKIIEKVVQKIVQVPKIVQVQKVVQKIITETQVVQVEKIVNNVVYQIKEVQKIVQKIVTIEKVVEKMVQVPVYVEKLVEKLVQVPTIVEVQKIVQKVVKDTEVKVVKQNNLQIEVAIEVVDRVVEKIVVVDNYIQKLVQVPKVIQKIVPVKSIQTIVKEVQVIKQKIVLIYQIKQVQKVVNIVVPLIKQVEKIVQRKIQIPFYEQKLITVPQIITRIEIQRIQVPKIIEIVKVVERPIIKNNIVEIEKPVIHYVTDYQIIKHNVQKIIPVPKTVEKIKEVKVHVDKLIQKLVQVPKVVEVQKIIEKVVVIPRIIQKIVQVPQIVETVVEKVIEIEKIVQIERQIEVPVIKQVIVEVEVVKNVYIQVQKIVDRVVEKIVPFQTVVQRIVEVPYDIQRVIPLKKQVPKSVQVEKIITNIIQIEKVVQIQKPITMPVEVPVQVQRIVQKIVVVQNNFQKIVQIPQIIQRIVQIHTELVEVEQVQRIVERIIPKNIIQTVTENNVIIQNKSHAVPTVIQKLVPVKEIVKQIVQVEKIVEKVVERIIQVPKIIQVQRIVQKIVKVPEYIQLEKIVPQLIKVNNVVQTIVQKIVSIPLIQQVIKSIPTQIQKIIPYKQTQNKIHQIQVFRDKIIQIPKVVQIDQINNVIQKQLQIIQRFEQISVPIYSTIQKIIQVPQILQKIVQKIVMMPQVVEVIKNIHHIPDSIGTSLPEQISIKQNQHQNICNDLKKNLDVLAKQLRKLKPQHPNLKSTIQSVERMFNDLLKSVNYNRVVTIPEQVIVHKEVTKPVIANNPNTKKDNDISIALALLSSKLVSQISRIKRQIPSIKLNLDEGVILTFFPQFSNTGQINLQFQKQLRSYTDIVLNKFRKLGGWKTDHEMILLNTLQQKFTNTQILKNLNEEIKKVRSELNTANSALKPLKSASSTISQKYKKLQQNLTKLLTNLQSEKINGLTQVNRYFSDFSNYIKQSFNTYKSTPIVRTISASQKQHQNVQINRLNSKLRESFDQLENLKSQFINNSANDPHTPTRTFRSENELKRQIQRLQSELTNGFSSTSQRQLRIQFQTKLRDQASFYERQLFEMKGLSHKDSINQSSMKSAHHSTNGTSMLDSSRLGYSRIESSNHRVLTSPSSNHGYSSPDRAYGRSMYSSMIKKL